MLYKDYERNSSFGKKILIVSLKGLDVKKKLIGGELLTLTLNCVEVRGTINKILAFAVLI
jgi:hypothetical protein